MSKIEIAELTSDRQALIPVYREKWRHQGLVTEPIDHNQATVAIEAVYNLIGLPPPKIHFFASPIEALEIFDLDNWSGQTVDIETRLAENLKKQLSHSLWVELHKQLYGVLHAELWNLVGSHIYNALNPLFQSYHALNSTKLSQPSYFNPAQDCIPTEYLVSNACLFDFCSTIFSCSDEEKLWEAYQLMVQNCGWLWTYVQVCLVCDRPHILSLDSEGRLHNEGYPGIQLADGFSIYAYHGVFLPEKYGRVPPNKWQSSWLLTENNAELRRVLIQGIGYARICQELKAKEIDNWQEYKLLKIDAEFDFEPVYLLTMICPSTAHQHALRVPPNLLSAREAIRWVNWGIDPTEFTIQT